MKLARTTECRLFEINAPIWNGGKRVVGLNLARVGKHNEIVFTYIRKSDGQKSFPDHYYVSGDLIKKYPTQEVRGGVKLALVPFTDLQILEREQEIIVWEQITDPDKMPENIKEIFFENRIKLL